MSIYQVKHKARGRYGVIMPNGQWLEGFLGNKQEATLEADKCNQQLPFNKGAMVEKANKQMNFNTSHQFQFVLTKEGWLKKGV